MYEVNLGDAITERDRTTYKIDGNTLLELQTVLSLVNTLPGVRFTYWLVFQEKGPIKVHK
jgi:hypothetical protein